MKRALLITLLLSVCIIAGCKKESELQSYYSEKQEKAFKLFNGTWADIQFSNLSGWPGLPDPDKIVFGKHNQEPIEIYEYDYMNGNELLFTSHGECTYHQMYNGNYEFLDCYYEVSKNADIFRLYHKGGDYNNRLFNRYNMSIQSETKISLHNTQLSLPYVFVKQ